MCFMEKMGPGKANPTGNVQVLIDSDAFVGWMLAKDAHHQQTVQIFERLIEDQVAIATTNLVVGETATVLSHRQGQALAKTFLDQVIEASDFPIIFIDEDLHQQALDIFKQQTKRGISLTDCANVAVIQRFGITSIFSFDRFYTKEFGLNLADE